MHSDNKFWLWLGGGILAAVALAVVMGVWVLGTGLRRSAQRDLLRAAEKGNHTAISAALKDGAKINEPVKGRTALFWAVQGNKPETILFLVKRGADPNFRDPSNSVPLTFAINTGRRPCVRALLKAGADANVLNSSHLSALQLAIFRDDVDSAERLLKAGANPDYGVIRPSAREMGAEKPAFRKLLIRYGYKVPARRQSRLPRPSTEEVRLAASGVP